MCGRSKTRHLAKKEIALHVVKYNYPSKTWAIPHTPWAALAQILSLGLSSESLESSLEEERSEMGLSSWCPSPNQNHSPNPCLMRLHYICTELKLGTKLIRSLRLL